MTVFSSKEFKAWYDRLSLKDQGIVDTRIEAFKINVPIDIKPIKPEEVIWEFRWDSGMRVYFAYVVDLEGKATLLLCGGNKNSQTSDILEARKIYNRAFASIEKKKAAAKKTTVKKATKKVAKKRK